MTARILRAGRLLTVVVAVAGGLSVRADAASHRSFTACAVEPGGSKCTDYVVYKLGQTVRLRGLATPPPQADRAQVWRKNPYSTVFRKVATVEVSGGGRVRWAWHTTQRNLAAEAPYRFQFRIPGGSRSEVVHLFLFE